MPDVTISQLSTGTPNKNTAVIPYSDGTTTLKTSPSGIVAASPGSVIQLAFATYNTKVEFRDPSQYYNFFYTYFTPKSNTSKVFIQSIFYVGGNGGIRIRRNTVPIFEPVSSGGNSPYQFFSINGQAPDANTMRANYCINWLDEPNTNEQITYNFDVRPYSSVGIGFNQNSYGSTPAPCTITLMEIAG